MSEALEILKSCDAFLEGHFLLSSGRHSGAYCQMAYLQQYPDRCAEVMKAVADKVKEMDVDVIVGPAMGGIVYGSVNWKKAWIFSLIFYKNRQWKKRLRKVLS